MDTLRENSIPEREELKKHSVDNKRYDREVPVMSNKEYDDLLTALSGGRECKEC